MSESKNQNKSAINTEKVVLFKMSYVLVNQKILLKKYFYINHIDFILLCVYKLSNNSKQLYINKLSEQSRGKS